MVDKNTRQTFPDSIRLHKKIFHAYQSDKKWEFVRKFLNTKFFTANQTGAGYRVLSSWTKSGLMPDGVALEGWKRFTVVEAVWLEIIRELRSFGVSIEEIKKIKDAVIQWDGSRYKQLECYLFQAISSSDDPYVIIWDNGSDVASSQEIELLKAVNGSESHILISLKSVLDRVKIKCKKPTSLVYVNMAELEVLNAIRHQKGDRISLSKSDSRLISMEVQEELKLEDWAEVKKELIKDGSFATIIDQIENGNEVSKRVTRKKKL